MQPFQLSDVLLLKKVGKKLKIRGTPKRCLEYILPSSMGIWGYTCIYIYIKGHIYIYEGFFSCLVGLYRGRNTTQLYRDYDKPI